jgi:hypothetical protein
MAWTIVESRFDAGLAPAQVMRRVGKSHQSAAAKVRMECRRIESEGVE